MSEKKQANYKEFSELPAWTRAVFDESGGKALNDADPFKWSGDADPPAIGAKVKVYMNNLGTGTVTGYFVEYGWFGVLVKFDNPPAWWVKQNPKQPPGHIFGIDLQPRKVKA